MAHSHTGIKYFVQSNVSPVAVRINIVCATTVTPIPSCQSNNPEAREHSSTLPYLLTFNNTAHWTN